MGGLFLIIFMALTGKLEGLPPIGFGGQTGLKAGLPGSLNIPGFGKFDLPMVEFTSGIAGGFGEAALISKIPFADSVEGQSFFREQGVSVPDMRGRFGRI